MEKYLVLFVSILTVACASRPAFKEVSSGSGVGYSLKVISQSQFEATAILGADVDSEFKEMYLSRAVGENCYKNGFQFWDEILLTKNVTLANCFKENRRPALGVTVAAAGLQENPKLFIVEELNNKPETNLKKYDSIKKVAGTELTEMSQLKLIPFTLANTGSTTIPLEIVREGKYLSIAEPLVNLKGSNFGPDHLDHLRNTIQ